MIMALIAYWPIGMLSGWLLAFPLGFGAVGIWFGFLIGLASAALMMCVRFVILLKKEMRAVGV
jgi:MATE family multidrug resistance protein